MSKPIANVVITSDTWSSLISKFNQALYFISTEVLSANSTTANTTGNAQLIGIFGANTIAITGSLVGGNVSTANTLTIASNVNISGVTNANANVNLTGVSVLTGNTTLRSNSTINLIQTIGNSITASVTLNGNSVTINPNTTLSANVTIAGTLTGVQGKFSTGLNVASNVSLSNTALLIGNSIVNSVINSVTITTTNYIASNSSTVGSNVVINTGGAIIGNSTANSVITSTLIQTANTISVASLTPKDLTIGTATVNALQVSTATGKFTTAVNVGSNVFVNSSSLFIGNTTVNAIVNSTFFTGTANIALTANNATNLGGAGAGAYPLLAANNTFAGNNIFGGTNTTFQSNVTAAVGTTTTLDTLVATTGKFSGSVNVGSNVALSPSTLNFGNTTVNSIANSVIYKIADASSIANLTSSQLAIGGMTVNSSTLAIANATFNVSAHVGSNVNLTTSQIGVGNSIANALVNSIIVQVASGLAVTNVTSSGIAVGSASFGSSAMNQGTGTFSVTVTVGANVVLSNTGLLIGNSTVNSIANSSTFKSGTFSGTTFTGTQGTFSSTITVTDQVVSTAIDKLSVSTTNMTATGNIINGVISLNNTAIIIGNSTVNSVSNSTLVKLTAGIGQTANLTVSGLTVGTTTVNGTTIAVANGNYTNKITVGANVILSTDSLTIGNSSVNSFVNSTFASFIANSSLTANNSNNLGGQPASAYPLLAANNTFTGNNILGGTNTHITSSVDLQNTVLLETVSNTDIGTGASVVLYSFPKATFAAAKFIVRAKNSGVYQTSEILLGTDQSTNAELTTYGTIVVPASVLQTSPLGTFTSNVNAGNIELVFNQTGLNTNVLTVVQLIK